VNPHLSQPIEQHGCAPRKARLAVIALHGRDRDPADILAIADRIAVDDICYVAPAAHGNSWYPNRFMEPLESNQPQLDHALERVDTLVAEQARAGFDPAAIVLLGFSQGACLACEYAVRNARRYGGVIAFTGGLIGAPGTRWNYPGNFHGTPVLLATTDADPWVPAQRVQETARVMAGMGAGIELAMYPGTEHAVNDDEIARSRVLLARAADTAGRMPRN
jgi:predicted esterase